MIKVNVTIFVWNWVGKDDSCYLKNEQLKTPFSVIYCKGEVL